MSIGAPVLLTTGLIAERISSLSARAVAIIAWLTVVNTAVAFTLWNRSLRHLAAVESSVINNTILIQIAALAWIFLDESPGPIGVAGIDVVSLGAFLTTFSRRRRT
jgi:drug/metabolite transporter (DMT)-like permease